MTYDPSNLCNPCWFQEHDRCYGCHCGGDEHAQTAQNSHRTPTDGLVGSSEGDGTNPTGNEPQREPER